MKLYFTPGACSFVPHALLEASGAPFEPTIVKMHKGEHKSPEYLAMNPRGQVPVLLDNGQAITQVIAISNYLDAKFPDQQFFPRDALARARAYEMLAWMNNTVHPTFTHVFRPQNFTDNETVAAALPPFNLARFRTLLGEIDTLAANASPFLTGAHFGPADAYALILARWGGSQGIDPTGYKHLWPFIERIAALPAVARTLERERIQIRA